MKKKTILPLLSLILSLAALAVSILALSAVPEDQSHLIDDLYRENTQLRQQLEDLTSRLDRQQTAATLQSFSLEVTPWADSTGADISLTAIPSSHSAQQDSQLVVYRSGEEVAHAVCIWDGVHLSATVSLTAADGYSYYLLLGAGGTTQTLPLTSPEDGAFENAVYLESALSAYCNLVVTDWQMEEGVLTLTDAFAQVQLPRVSALGEARIETAQLVLRKNGAESARSDISLQPSEVEGSLDTAIHDLGMATGELEEGDTLELTLEVVLNDGRNLTAFGISWLLQNGELSSAVG